MTRPLPEAVPPAGAYLPARRWGNTVHVSGQVPLMGGRLMATGLVGADVATGQAYQCAAQCALNVLAALSVTLGGLDPVPNLLKVTVFVAAAPGFTDLPAVADGASDVFIDFLGEPGRHARSAVGVATLPLNAPVEVEAVFTVLREQPCPTP